MPSPDEASEQTTRQRMIEATLDLISTGGEGAMTTRAVCKATGVTAPSLYHHFGTLDGLLNAALEHAFGMFLASKARAGSEADPMARLVAGWDDYVDFAARAPGLYAAMIGRVLKGVPIPAAEAARAILVNRIEDLARTRKLSLPAEAAADAIWASAHAAAMLHVFPRTPPPDPRTMTALRGAALAAILAPI